MTERLAVIIYATGLLDVLVSAVLLPIGLSVMTMDAGCFREVAALYSALHSQVPLFMIAL